MLADLDKEGTKPNPKPKIACADVLSRACSSCRKVCKLVATKLCVAVFKLPDS